MSEPGDKKPNLERRYWHIAGIGEELLLGTLLIVTLAWAE
jgi:hypothetical protein